MKKIYSLLVMMLLGFAAATAATSTLTFTAACGGSGAADDGTVWTVTSDGTESNFDSARGIHYGTGSANVQYLQLSTSGISGTISKVVVNATDAQAKATLTVTVGGEAFGSGQTVASGTSGADYTFTDSGSGAIVVRLDRGSSMSKALYVKSIAVTYSTGDTPVTYYNVTIDDTIEHGTVTASTNTAAEGEIVTLTVAAASGYQLATLTVEDDDDNEVAVNNNQFTMPASDVYVSATFEERPAANGDVLNRDFTGSTGTSYSDWSGKEGDSGAIYAGNSAGGNDAIQLRSKNNSGIVSTTSGGNVRKVTVTWNSNTDNGRTLDIYGSNTAYTAASELYSSSTQGTKLGSIVYGTSTVLEIEGDYAYVGLRSNSGAMYLDEIVIEWEAGAAPAIATPEIRGITPFENQTEVSITCATTGVDIYYTLDGNDPDDESTPYSAPFTITEGCTVKAIATDGTNWSAVASMDFVKSEPVVPITTLAQVWNVSKDLASGASGEAITFSGDAGVVYQHGSYLYLQDETGSALIYGSGVGTFSEGNVLTSGWSATPKNYNGLIELTEPSSLSVASGATYEPVLTTLAVNAITNDMQNKYVKLENITVGAWSSKNFTLTDENENSIQGRDGIGLFNGSEEYFGSEDKYDVIGFVAGVYSGAQQFYPISFTKVIVEGQPLASIPAFIGSEGEQEFGFPVIALGQVPAASSQGSTGGTGGMGMGSYTKGALYVIDATNEHGLLVYGDITEGYGFGDVIPAGIKGTYANFQEMPEMTNPVDETFVNSTTTSVPTPFEASIADITQANFGRYAVLRGATITKKENESSSSYSIPGLGDSDSYTITIGSSSVGAHDTFSAAWPEDLTKTYDIYGICLWYKGIMDSDAQPHFIPLRFEEGTAPEPVSGEATFDFNTEGGNYYYAENTVIKDVTLTAGDVSLVFSKNNGTDPMYYSSDHTARAYNGSTMTFSVPTGSNITAIAFDYERGGAGSADSGTYSNGAWSGSANNVVISLTETTRIKSITVTYEAEGPVSDEFYITASPAAGTYEGPQTIFITGHNGDIEEATYTIDGVENDYDPQAGVTISQSCTISFYALDSEANEATLEAAYTITYPELAVTLTPEAGTYYEAQNVKVAVDNVWNDGDYLIAYQINHGTPADYDDEDGIDITESCTLTITIEADYQEFTQDYEYVITEAPETKTFVKVTSTEGLVSGKYLIVYEAEGYALDGSLPSLDVVNNYAEVTINDATIKAPENIAFTLNAAEGSFLSTGGLYIGHTGTSNGLSTRDNPPFENEVSIDADGNAVIALGEYSLRFNKASDQKRFRYFKGTQQPVALYLMLDEGITLAEALAGGEGVISDELVVVRVFDGKAYVTDGEDNWVRLEGGNAGELTPGAVIDGYQVSGIANPATSPAITLTDDVTFTANDNIPELDILDLVGGIEVMPKAGKLFTITGYYLIENDSPVFSAYSGKNGSKGNTLALADAGNMSVDARYTIEAAVELAEAWDAEAPAGAPRRVSPTSDDALKNVTVSLVSEPNAVTGVNDITIDADVVSVKYVNVAGQVSDKPFDGMNIVVTTYDNGNTKAVKVVK